MKKVLLFGIVVAAASVAGGATSYWVGKSMLPPTLAGHNESNVSAYFTGATQQHQLPDLTLAAEKAVAAVVNIEKSTTNNDNSRESEILNFFGIPLQMPQQTPQRGLGSGVIISADGYIVTNNHVIADASSLKVTLNDKKSYAAKVVGTDPTADVALIKIDAKGLPYLLFGDSDALKLGEWVLAIGNPFNLTSTVTAGIVSAKARNLDVIDNNYRIESFIQTDAAVNPGNSGGALVNARGEVVGINTVIKSPTGSYAGYSFAVPASIVHKIVADIQQYGAVQRAMLGISMQEIDDEFIEQLGAKHGIKEVEGVYVAGVTDNGAAKAAGIQVGDVIIGVDGTHIESSSQVQELIAKLRPNDKVKLDVKRMGKVKHFEVILRNRIGNTQTMKSDMIDAASVLGGAFREIPAQMKKELKINGGIQVISIGDGILQKLRIRPGFVISHINEHAVQNLNDINSITHEITSIDGIYPDGRVSSYSIFNR